MHISQVIPTIAVIAWIPLSLLVGRAAKSYDRSASVWFVLAMVFSPLAAFVFLIVADVPHQAVIRKEQESRVRARHPEHSNLAESAKYEMDCPNCGAPLNTSTGDGFHAPDGEPWRLLCDQCETEITT